MTSITLPPLDASLIEILGRPCFKCTGMAGILRLTGQVINRRAEDEQAAVIHYMLGFYFKSPTDWLRLVTEDMGLLEERFYDKTHNVKLLDLHACENGWKMARCITRYTGPVETNNRVIPGTVIFHESRGVGNGVFYKELRSALPSFELCKKLTEIPDKQPSLNFSGSPLEQFRAEFYDNGGVA